MILKQKTNPKDLPPLNGFGVYVHLPFCIQLCRYCNFNKVPRASVNREMLSRYQSALLRELDSAGKRFGPGPVRTLYFGGGTPSVYPAEWIHALADAAARLAPGLPPPREITVEVDPKTIRARTLSRYVDAGVNRVSIGAQSFSNALLERLGRYHRKRDILELFALCREAGFRNLSMDLMIGIPGQERTHWETDLEKAAGLAPEHVSLYCLELARGTEWYRQRKRLALPSPEQTAAWYRIARRFWKARGIRAYEISNFARPGFESKHNLDCWNRIPYIGIGAGASSFLENRRWTNVRDVDRYVRRLERKGTAAARVDKLAPRDRKMEFVMLRLRKSAGFSRNEYRKQFGCDPEKDFPGLFQKEIKTFVHTGNRIKLTLRGVLVSNEILQSII
jgi:oxygen-independent coproporphyrinogen-3 oxidase